MKPPRFIQDRLLHIFRSLAKAALSEKGPVREENQDIVAEGAVGSGYAFVLADGMGGHKGGRQAAELTVAGLLEHLRRQPGDAPLEQSIGEAFSRTNESVYARAHSGDPDTEGMGSTAVMLLVDGASCRVAHVGDSRAYLLKGEGLSRLTKDHSLVQRMIDTGMLKPEEAAGHPNANILVRAMGTSPEVEVDIAPEITLQEGDALLLCSDGLHGYVTDSEIHSILGCHDAAPRQIVRQLVDLALEKGSRDNVTVQYVKYGKRGGIL